MSCGIEHKEREVRFLEVWDKIRKRTSSSRCEAQETSCMLNNLRHYFELAKRNCDYTDREVYEMLYCILHEKLIEKNSKYAESKIPAATAAASCISDSGFGTFHSPKSPIISAAKDGQKLARTFEVTPRRLKAKNRRPRKIVLTSRTGTTVARGENNFDVDLVSGGIRLLTSPYPFMATALVCCFACMIALAPHRFFPWFVTWITFNSPPPL